MGQNETIVKANIVSKKKKVIAKDRTYEGEFNWLTRDIVQFYRHDNNRKKYIEIDANPDHWAFFVAFNLKPGQIGIRTSAGVRSFSGNVAIWFPMFSIIEWSISPGEVDWVGYLSTAKPPEGMPKKATLFNYTSLGLPNTKEEIFNFVNKSEKVALIEREIASTVLSEKIKKNIQLRFKENIFISDLAKEFGVSHEYISKSFKKCYGISPVYLRTRLRIFSAIMSLLRGDDVTKVAMSCGFNDVSRFTKQFTKMMKVPPVAYLKNVNGLKK